MTSPIDFRAVLALSLLTISGCATAPRDHTPYYSFVPTNSYVGMEKGVGGSVLVPEACLGEPADMSPGLAETDFVVTPALGPHLPPGCANAYNLQRMVESERDLIEGRTLGPARAAPSVRAAHHYLYGEEELLGGPSRSQDLNITAPTSVE
ncbi:hypothetical protein [Chelativorans salis]|uniref:Lipoprotein n=1 Tax=Chelativorans salis TaxID=2978478 RepID=A0ABT2LQM1_9HYPH|nr:hypothetical protein [Chelativorans sp. EGI FJ00035]MCT7376850.1 hypothetical protein [Chelativorans sp. EGI FJ00035]